MNQQGDPSFMAPGSSPPGNVMQGRMGGPPPNTMMPGMQGNPQGGSMYPSGDMKGWPQGNIPRNKYVRSSFLQDKFYCSVYTSIFTGKEEKCDPVSLALKDEFFNQNFSLLWFLVHTRSHSSLSRVTKTSLDL